MRLRTEVGDYNNTLGQLFICEFVLTGGSMPAGVGSLADLAALRTREGWAAHKGAQVNALQEAQQPGPGRDGACRCLRFGLRRRPLPRSRGAKSGGMAHEERKGR